MTSNGSFVVLNEKTLNWVEAKDDFSRVWLCCEISVVLVFTLMIIDSM